MKKPAALVSQAVAKAAASAAQPTAPNGSNILRPGNIDEGHANSAFKKPSSGEIKFKGELKLLICCISQTPSLGALAHLSAVC